jgi:hypothetical protein
MSTYVATLKNTKFLSCVKGGIYITVYINLRHTMGCGTLKIYTVVPLVSTVIRSKTYRGYVKPRITPNAIQT